MKIKYVSIMTNRSVAANVKLMSRQYLEIPT
jgi:hypothetical protein